MMRTMTSTTAEPSSVKGLYIDDESASKAASDGVVLWYLESAALHGAYL